MVCSVVWFGVCFFVCGVVSCCVMIFYCVVMCSVI